MNYSKEDDGSDFSQYFDTDLETTVALFLPIYVKLFNLVFDNGVMPDVWIAGIIKPIYKNKGDN